jgi:hypothetical protein
VDDGRSAVGVVRLVVGLLWAQVGGDLERAHEAAVAVELVQARAVFVGDVEMAVAADRQSFWIEAAAERRRIVVEQRGIEAVERLSLRIGEHDGADDRIAAAQRAAAVVDRDQHLLHAGRIADQATARAAIGQRVPGARSGFVADVGKVAEPVDVGRRRRRAHAVDTIGGQRDHVGEGPVGGAGGGCCGKRDRAGEQAAGHVVGSRVESAAWCARQMTGS